MQIQESACLHLESKRERRENICRLCKTTEAQLELLCSQDKGIANTFERTGMFVLARHGASSFRQTNAPK